MASRELEKELSELHVTTDPQCNGKSNSLESQAVDGDVQITCFTENLHDTTIQFQIIKLAKQMRAKLLECFDVTCTCFVTDLCLDRLQLCKIWAFACGGLNSPEQYGECYLLLRGTADNAGSSVARHLVLKTGLSLILACNIPKGSTMLEAAVERKLMEKVRSLGYIKPKPQASSCSITRPR